jgi:hypothetical protein
MKYNSDLIKLLEFKWFFLFADFKIFKCCHDLDLSGVQIEILLGSPLR